MKKNTAIEYVGIDSAFVIIQKPFLSQTKILVLSVLCLGVAVFGFNFFVGLPAAPKAVADGAVKPQVAAASLATETIGTPVELKIPSIELDAVIESVGSTPNGQMDVPKIPEDAGWYNAGVKPGEIGNAVLDGHYGAWKNGAKSVFQNLSKLEVGDKIYTKDEFGKITAFQVVKEKDYGSADDPKEVFEAQDGSAHLNLITCEGIWDQVTKSYSSRLVIFADKVE